MKKALLIIVALSLVLVGAAYLFRAQLWDAATEQLTAEMFVGEDTDSFDPGLPVGSPLPALSALYQGQVISDIGALNSGNGLILVANRSVDWCPYCMRQVVELHESAQAFAEAGLQVAVLTYDAPELQTAFARKHGIEFAMLSDIDAASVIALGILNTDYEPGDGAYGIPWPGIYVIDPSGMIKGKIFVEPYSIRVDAAGVLEVAKDSLGLTSPDSLPSSLPERQ